MELVGQVALPRLGGGGDGIARVGRRLESQHQRTEGAVVAQVALAARHSAHFAVERRPFVDLTALQVQVHLQVVPIAAPKSSSKRPC